MIRDIREWAIELALLAKEVPAMAAYIFGLLLIIIGSVPVWMGTKITEWIE